VDRKGGRKALRGGLVLEPKKVLVIDDSKLIHKIFGTLLRQSELIHAMDGQEALQRLGEHTGSSAVDLILLDINMPKMNGLEFLAKVKETPAVADIPVVIISTEGKEEDTVRGLKAGAAAYIKKPFQADEVLKIISRL